jgi:hypothetical protein
LSGAVIGTLLTKPTEKAVVKNFYKTTRPFGFWKPYAGELSSEDYKAMKREHRNDIIALPFVFIWQITLFMLPLQLMVGKFLEFTITGIIFIISLIGIYHFWYKNLSKLDAS